LNGAPLGPRRNSRVTVRSRTKRKIPKADHRNGQRGMRGRGGGLLSGVNQKTAGGEQVGLMQPIGVLKKVATPTA